MKKNLLPVTGKDFKVNLHTHTLLSDGNFTPEEVKARYQDGGYAAVAFTDHEIMVPHNDLTDEGFVALNGVECAVKPYGPQDKGPTIPLHHLCLIARDPSIDITPVFEQGYCFFGNMHEHFGEIRIKGRYHRIYGKDGMNRMIADAAKEGFLVNYNHPRWSLQSSEGYTELDGLCGIEVYNTGARFMGDCNAEPLDRMLFRGKTPFPIAADDMHRASELFGGWNILRAEKLDYASLIRALEHGDGYATQGPQIHALYAEDGSVHVTCSPAAEIRFRTEGREINFFHAAKGEALTSATYPLPERLPYYLRVEIVDATGKFAWSRAYTQSEWM